MGAPFCWWSKIVFTCDFDPLIFLFFMLAPFFIILLDPADIFGGIADTICFGTCCGTGVGTNCGALGTKYGLFPV
ncbi:MAG: hypothetical protein CML57_00180, partial [Rhodobacteraceae bacterium]|nr:hypothetical protein [Paracoccaceae bacterium]